VNARDKFESNFMTNYISGKSKLATDNVIFNKANKRSNVKIEFSPEAQAVFEAGKKLWQYYHAQINLLPLHKVTKELINASLYDIREFFQGRNAQGKMNNKSTDEKYNELMGYLREALKVLAQKIEPKVYEHGFLRK
jgi:hypothetical protein